MVRRQRKLFKISTEKVMEEGTIDVDRYPELEEELNENQNCLAETKGQCQSISFTITCIMHIYLKIIQYFQKYVCIWYAFKYEKIAAL